MSENDYSPDELVDRYLGMIAARLSNISEPIHGFVFTGVDHMVGSWEWFNEKSGVVILATIGYDLNDALPIAISNDDGELYEGEDKDFKVSELTFNLSQDVASYLTALKGHFKKYSEKIVKPKPLTVESLCEDILSISPDFWDNPNGRDEWTCPFCKKTVIDSDNNGMDIKHTPDCLYLRAKNQE